MDQLQFYFTLNSLFYSEIPMSCLIYLFCIYLAVSQRFKILNVAYKFSYIKSLVYNATIMSLNILYNFESSGYKYSFDFRIGRIRVTSSSPASAQSIHVETLKSWTISQSAKITKATTNQLDHPRPSKRHRPVKRNRIISTYKIVGISC